MVNPFFKNTGPYELNFLLKTINLKNEDLPEKKINDIKDLNSSQENEITFFHSKKYSSIATTTKASYCVTQVNIFYFLPTKCKKILVSNVLLTMAKITKEFKEQMFKKCKVKKRTKSANELTIIDKKQRA